MEPKISVIIPFYPVDEEKHEILKRCVNSLPEHYETIIVWNRKEGMAKAINEGALCASGTHLLIMNDDVIYEHGKLEDLCFEDKVASPTFNGRVYKHIWGSCFCVPKKVWDAVGGMDDRYTISYFDDDDLIHTLHYNGYTMGPVSSVSFNHPHPGRTLEALPERDTFFTENESKFLNKLIVNGWKRL